MGFVLFLQELKNIKMKASSFLLVALLFSASACEPPKQTTQEIRIADPAHTSQNSFDWQGVYTGTLPCADCEGILTTLILREGLNYTLETNYLGRTGETQTKTGTFGWNASGHIVTLENVDETTFPAYYAVGENHVTRLDLQGNKIEGELADKYTLIKDQSGITEKYWKLIELNGSEIASPSAAGNETYMLLKAANKLLMGNGGCNSFNGAYEISDGSRISFSKIASTLMACSGVETEGQLFAVFDMTDNFSVKGDTLSLNKAKMSPLARFVLIKND